MRVGKKREKKREKRDRDRDRDRDREKREVSYALASFFYLSLGG